jgi:enoyl-CoA hydratase/carnithine racemase
MNTEMDPVLFQEIQCVERMKVGLATLNAPFALNSLSMEMISSLQNQLNHWFQDPSIALVFLQGAGEKAFCAGGDIRRLYEAMQTRNYEGAEEFFYREYRLDYCIHTSPKPIIVWGNGIVMGGGIGLMNGARFRVVTESSRLAMPEISIGLFPDVGGSYFLSRMPYKAGLFLALTAIRMNARDAIEMKIADFAVPHSAKEILLKKIQETTWTGNKSDDEKSMNRLLESLPQISELAPSELTQNKKWIERAMTGESLSEVLNSFEKMAKESPWLQKALTGLLKGSPTSAMVIFEQLKRGATLSLADAFEMEFRMAAQFVRHPDLMEGIRALIVDKDNSPSWRPSKISDVSNDLVEEHFRSPEMKRKNLL